VSSAETSDTGIDRKSGMNKRYKSVMPGPLVVTMDSSPKGPPVV